MTGQVFHLSHVPPSANQLFANVAGRGRIKTKRYMTWLNAARWEIQAAKPKMVEGPVWVSIAIERTSKLSDLDNRVKPTIDALQGLVIKNDRQVIRLFVEWADVTGVMVQVEPAEAA